MENNLSNKSEFLNPKNFFNKIKHSNLLIYINKFMNFEELFKIANINKSMNRIIKDKMMMTSMLNNLEKMIKIKFENKFSNLLISEENNYLDLLKEYTPTLIHTISSIDKLKIFLMKFCISHFKLKENYKDDKIFIRGNKLTIFKTNENIVEYNELIVIFISVFNIKRIKEFGNFLKGEFLLKVDLEEYITKDLKCFINMTKVPECLKYVKSLGILNLKILNVIHNKKSIKSENIERLKIKFYDTEGKNSYNRNENELGSVSDFLKEDFPNLQDVIVVKSTLIREEDVNEFLDKLYEQDKTLNLIKLKNLNTTDNDSFHESSSYDSEGEEKGTPTVDVSYNLHEYIVNTKKFKIVGGELRNFNLASDFLNANENVENLILKGQKIREKDFIKFLKNIEKDSQIKNIKTSINYSEKIIKTLAKINRNLDKNIKLLKY